MTIELKDGRYFKAIIQFEFQEGRGIVPPPVDGNLLGAMYTDDPERRRWQLVYRFRYYVDDNMGRDSEDEKKWFTGEAIGSEEEIWNETLTAFSNMALSSLSILNVALIESADARVQMDKLQELPNMNTERVPAEEMKPDPSLN